MSDPPSATDTPATETEKGSVDFPEVWYDLSGPDHFWFQWRFAAALRQIRAVGVALDRPLRVLEVGGGSGVLRDQIESHTAWTVDITDLKPSALRRARDGRGRKLCYDILEERAELLGSYDVVFLFDVLEHLKATAPFLRAVARHLRSGGHLFLNVPALPILYGSYDRSAGHLRRYGPNPLRSEIEGTGLAVLDLRYWGLALVPVAALRTLLLARRSDSEQIIRDGFTPPGRLTHALLKALMRLETRLLARPPLGAALLLACRKAEP